MLCSACIRPVEQVLPLLPPQPVLNGILAGGKPLTVYLAWTIPAGDTAQAPRWIEAAILPIWENGLLLDTLDYLGEGRYESSYIARAGFHYRVEAQISGYETMWAETTVPNSIPIDSAIYRFSSRTNPDGIRLMDYVGYFSDVPDVDDFYEAHIYVLDRTGGISKRNYLDNVNADIIDPVLLAEVEGLGGDAFGIEGFLFSDVGFAGKAYGLQLTFTTSHDPGTFDPLVASPQFFELHHVTQTYYRYQKSLARHFRGQAAGAVYGPGDFDFIALLELGEPSALYSNVENGLGIFAAYQASEHEYQFSR